MDSKSLSSFLSLAGTYKEGELLVPGPAQSAFMLAFNRSLTEDEQHSITVQVAMGNPGASPQELIAARHAFKLKAGLEALKKKRHGEMDSSLSLSLSAGNKGKTGSRSSVDAKTKDASPLLLQLGTVKRTTSPSLRSERKSDAPWEAVKYSLSLTEEEIAIVHAETRTTYPDSDARTFTVVYKLALWDADAKKKGRNPGGNLGKVDLSSLSETDDELRPHKLNDSMQRLHERLGCHSQHSIPIGFFYAKWCEKLHFHLARANRQGSPSTASSTRTRTPSPTPAPANRFSSPSVAPIIASSSAATRDMSIKEAEANLNDIREKRAAIFDETKDGLLTKKDKAVFWYRQGRRREWQAVAAETMLSESDWNDQHDQESLEKLRKVEEQLETLLAEHEKFIGYGPAGQGSN